MWLDFKLPPFLASRYSAVSWAPTFQKAGEGPFLLVILGIEAVDHETHLYSADGLHFFFSDYSGIGI